MNNKSLLLFSSYHKPYPLPSASYIIPIHAGKALSKINLPMEGDNTGEQISERNSFYSELTILYWVWKNFDRKKMDYWGIVHYRRYFCVNSLLGKIFNKKVYNYSESGKDLDAVLNTKLENEIINDLQNYDVILPKPMHTYKKRGITKSINQHYIEDHSAFDWDVTLSVIKEKYPAYQNSFPFFEGSKMSFFNMMITSWKIWDLYLSWLFDILFEVDKQIPKSDDPYQRRVMGFISERLINLFVYHNKLKVKYYAVAAFDKKD